MKPGSLQLCDGPRVKRLGAAIEHTPAVIFNVLDALPSRQKVTLINDHDPKPLFYQLDAEKPGAFTRQVVDPPQANLFAVVITRVPRPDEVPLWS